MNLFRSSNLFQDVAQLVLGEHYIAINWEPILAEEFWTLVVQCTVEDHAGWDDQADEILPNSKQIIPSANFGRINITQRWEPVY